MKRFILPKIRLFRVKTIGAELFLAVMGGAFVGLGSTAFLYYQVLENQSKVQIRGTLSTEVHDIESQLTPVKQSLINLGGMVQHLKETGVQDPEAYQEVALDFFLKRPPLVMGQSLQQSPYGIFADRKWYSSYYYEDQKVSGQIGKRLPSPNTSVIFSDLVKEDNAPNQTYFKNTIAVSHDTWLEPYDWYNTSMTTANHLLLDRRGRLQGFVSMDVNATQLSATIHPTVFRDTGYFVVMTRWGKLVSYPPNMGKVGQSYRSIPALEAIWPLLQKDASGLFQSNGQYWGYQRIPSTQWIMLAVVPESVVLWPVLATTLGGAGIAAIVLAIVVICFVQLLNHRLKPVLQECYRLEAEDAQRSIRLGQVLDVQNAAQQNRPFNFKDVDELEILQQVFWRVTAQLKVSFDDLELRVAKRTAQLDEAKQSAENAKEVAIAANQSKSQFLANMSHELRTPLNAILGFAQLMNRETLLSKDHRESLQIIIRSGERLLSLINDVLDMSKIEAGRVSLYKSDFSLFTLLDSVKEILSLRANVKELQFIFNYADNLPTFINTDEKKLHQILLNLLSNAVKFTESGFVSLSVEIDDVAVMPSDVSHYLRFVVEDSGPGIAAHELSTLFETFVQTESGRNAEQGTGLGLSISRTFVELMGGRIRVSSTLGQGSRFEFIIPVGLSTAGAQPRQVPVQRVIGLAKPHLSHRILVVDDNWENRQLLVKLLEPIGFKVKEAANGQEAIACWEVWHPHLIWMDMRMPVLNGINATQHIKAHPQGQSTVIIALTASALSEEIPSFKSAGCNDFVRKPFLECEIFDKIAQHLNVEYTFETLVPILQQEPVQPLTSTALSVMPPSWLEELAKASALLDEDTIRTLISKIPQEHIELKKSIQSKLENFDFHHIFTTVQQVKLHND
jgi:signal transduction histidine kinase/DNA-binding NarL/FixJ family response regulator